MNKFIYLLFLTFFLGCSSSQQVEIKPFTTDGCSCFPEGDFSDSNLWHHCCVAHDKIYWQGGTAEQRQNADRALEQCVADTESPVFAFSMYYGVRFGGWAYYPTSFRWGYGWDYPRGYDPLSKDELIAVEIAKAQSPYFQ